MGTQLPSPKGAQPPIFGPYLLWLNGCMDQDATWYGGRPQPEDFVLDGNPDPSPKMGQRPLPKFSAHVYCGQNGWTIKMALGMEVGLGPGHIVLDGDPAYLSKKAQSSPRIFRPFLLWPNGWMHQGATWYGSRPQPSLLC